MNSPYISGIDPFANDSTFQCDSLHIPRGIFLGGRLYLTNDFQLPFHISYIDVGVWGIADATGMDAAAIYFRGAKGEIYSIDGVYAGCIKGRDSLYNSAPSNDLTSLEVFLNSITRRHELDLDSLIWDINWCSQLPQPAVSPLYNTLTVPGELVADDGGQYFLPAETSKDAGEENLKAIQFAWEAYSSGSVLSSGATILKGPHVMLYPMKDIGVGDVVVAVKDGGVMVCNHRSFE